MRKADSIEMEAPSVRVREIALFERYIRFEKPFRFGAVTVHGAPQAFVRVEIEVGGKSRSVGASAELMVPKWFNKNPDLGADETIEELRSSLQIARDLYLSVMRPETAFGLHAECIAEQMRLCAELGIPSLAAGFGPAEIDKAVFDAVLRSLRLDVFHGLADNVVGLDARLTPDLDHAAISRFLAGQTPRRSVAVRHTVGLLDAIEGEEGIIAKAAGGRYFKLKLGGDVAADRMRLVRIAGALDCSGIDYRVTLDANEQYGDLRQFGELLDALSRDPALTSLRSRLLYLEQPLPRERSLDEAVAPAGQVLDFILDEADDSYDAFRLARDVGYRGISSKSCKGIYKSLLNGARAALWNEQAPGSRYFISAEDLTCQPGLALQQDTALVAFQGIEHVERNGHQYVKGFWGATEREACAFLSAHPDLYQELNGSVVVAVRRGELVIGSLFTPGFASAAAPCWENLPRMSSRSREQEKASWQPSASA